jgi:hypothetical protein
MADLSLERLQDLYRSPNLPHDLLQFPELPEDLFQSPELPQDLYRLTISAPQIIKGGERE